MKRVNHLFITLASIIAAWSCTKDFVVKKIVNDSVTVLAPANNTVTNINAITFWWEAMDGADKYSIQVVKPNFAAIQQLVADTNVTGTKFLLSLTPGNYQWRIRGVNGGGNSKYTVFNLTVDSTSNLSSQLVVAIGPLNNFVTGGTSITFSWNPIVAANKYNIQVNSNPAIDMIITSTFFTSTFTPGSYTWKVKALNDFSISQFNPPMNFKIDQTAPGAPNNLSVSGTLNTKVLDTLKWKRSTGINASDIRYDSLYIYSDPALSSVNTQTALNSVNIHIGDLLTAPTTSFLPYWWRVKSVDSVGNRSVFSSTSTFTLTP